MKVIIFVEKADTLIEGIAVQSVGPYLEFSHRMIQNLSLVFDSVRDATCLLVFKMYNS
jgi:hypothetical protein